MIKKILKKIIYKVNRQINPYKMRKKAFQFRDLKNLYNLQKILIIKFCYTLR